MAVKFTYTLVYTFIFSLLVGVVGALLIEELNNQKEFKLITLTEQPNHPRVGAIYLADGNEWNPCNLKVGKYYVMYTETNNYTPLMSTNGKLIFYTPFEQEQNFIFPDKELDLTIPDEELDDINFYFFKQKLSI